MWDPEEERAAERVPQCEVGSECEIEGAANDHFNGRLGGAVFDVVYRSTYIPLSVKRCNIMQRREINNQLEERINNGTCRIIYIDMIYSCIVQTK